MTSSRRPLLFLLFFVSGFCGLVYQVVWTRLAFASFGIITPVLSVVISVFMLGLSLGAWGGGRWIGPLAARTGPSAVMFYSLAEAIIGLGAFAVPRLFHLGEHLLLATGQSDSLAYLFLSAVVLALSILPWCLFMGTTFPFMMAYVRERQPATSDSFSYLYLANVLGAMTGALLTALVFVELLGFRHTLWVAAGGNFLVAAVAASLGRAARRSNLLRQKHYGGQEVQSPTPMNREQASKVSEGGSGIEGRGSAAEHGTRNTQHAIRNTEHVLTNRSIPQSTNPSTQDSNTPTLQHSTLPSSRRRVIQFLLFSTGFAAMAMEVVWVRAFAPVLKTLVYSFALIVAAYLGATAAGSALYRRHLRRGAPCPTPELIALLCAAAFLPVLANDTRFVHAHWSYYADPLSALVLLGSICPFCGLLGYLTPGLIDEYSAGSPAGAGNAYALNVLGCILGPLFASYVLLPHVSERYTLVLLGLPSLSFLFFYCRTLGKTRRLVFGILAGVMAIWGTFFSQSYEDLLLKTQKRIEVRRDYAASVIAYGEKRDEKLLLVNGLGVTSMTPITKFMVHLPLAFHTAQPQSALIICFGMGTSFRAALSWDIRTTSVELVPSVKAAFGFFHADAARVASHPEGHIVIDDGRRFLMRTREKFDVIVVDPPPPPETAGSSLLYSDEFYDLVKLRLKTHGILQAWVPGGNDPMMRAAARSVRESFPFVRCFPSVEGWGAHLLASMEPIPTRSAKELAARLPAKAQEDLLEWSTALTPAAYLDEALSQEIPIEKLLHPNPAIRITDDRPYNEYFLLRQWDLF